MRVTIAIPNEFQIKIFNVLQWPHSVVETSSKEPDAVATHESRIPANFEKMGSFGVNCLGIAGAKFALRITLCDTHPMYTPESLVHSQSKNVSTTRFF